MRLYHSQIKDGYYNQLMLRVASLFRNFGSLSPLAIFKERDLMYQSTAQPILSDSRFVEIAKESNGGKCSVYCGYDPTSDSLHLGNLVSIIMLGRLSQIGIEPVFLVGGATGMIGDPSGKSKQRNLLKDDDLDKNIKGITSDITKVYGNLLSLLQKHPQKYNSHHVNTSYKLLNNADFYKHYNIITFLRDVGKNFRVNVMLAKEAVSKRVQSEEGISYTEFSYGLLQAYDFWKLNEQEGCVIQIGGSDQWGNIIGGCDYVRRMAGKEVYGITMPLLLTPTGEKFGKSQGNALFLNSHKTPSSTIYQYLISTPDTHVKSYLKIFSLLPIDKIDQICEQHSKNPQQRLAQKALADEVINLLTSSFQNPHELFYKVQDFKSLTLAQLTSMVSKLDQKDVMTISTQALKSCRDAVDLIYLLGVKKTKAELRRQVSKGGVYISNQKLEAEESSWEPKKFMEKNLLCGKFLVVRFGKKHYRVIYLA